MTFQKATAYGNSNEWTNPEDLKDPEILPTLCQEASILISPLDVKEKTTGGVIIPGASKDDLSFLQNVGRILSLSDSLEKEDLPFKVGDLVSWQKFNGQKFLYNDNGKTYKLVILDYRDVMVKIDSPERLDPVFNMLRQ
jgi:co-chaperonin GroES (HSP10)